MDIIKAEMRNPATKAKQLRRSGFIPCVIDGASLKESLCVQINLATASQLKRTKRKGSNADIEVDGKIFHTLIKELDYNSMTDSIVHISFHILDAGKKVNSVVDIVLLNKDKVQGVLEQIQLTVPHAAQPEYLLDTVTIDLAGVPIGTTLRIGDIPEFQSDNIELQADPGNIVLRISDKKRVIEKPEEVEEAEEAEEEKQE